MNRFPTPVLTGSGSKSIISAEYIGTSNGQIKTKRFICKQIHFYIKSVIYLIKKGNYMEIFICRGYSGQIYRMNVNEHLLLNDIIPIIAEGIGFYTANQDRIGMYNLSKDWEYLPQDSLISRGTQQGDLIILADGGSCHKE